MLVELDLPRDPTAGAVARRALEQRLAERLEGEALDNAKLVATELANNAVMHGLGEIRLRAELAADRLRLEVVDQGTGEVPGIRTQPLGGPGGWGLRVVEELSEDWGAFEGTTHVWAELAVA
jgi:anti-sigma regulatory factor (Ser/Thr protein kinase)